MCKLDHEDVVVSPNVFIIAVVIVTSYDAPPPPSPPSSWLQQIRGQCYEKNKVQRQDYYSLIKVTPERQPG